MAVEHHFQAHLVWTGAKTGPAREYATYSREHTVAIEGKPTLRASAAGAYRGDESLPNPEDLLLAAVAGCHMLSYLAECVRVGIVVEAYEDRCTARMAFADRKMRIVEATLRPAVTYADGTDREKALALHERAHEGCFIASSVNFPIVVQPQLSA